MTFYAYCLMAFNFLKEKYINGHTCSFIFNLFITEKNTNQKVFDKYQYCSIDPKNFDYCIKFADYNIALH